MSLLSNRIAASLRRLAAAPRPGELFAVGRVMTSGEPTLWQETISFEQGRLRQFSRGRSPVDEGGAPIGAWAGPADERRAQALAAALVQVAFWECQSDAELLPGMEIVNWSCVTREGVWDVLAAAGSPLFARLVPLDLELRRVANDLEAANRGASLRVILQAQAAAPGVLLRVTLVNDGHRPAILVNPFLTGGEFDFLRLELAPLPPVQPGVTDLPAVFSPLAVSLLTDPPPDPWQDAYIPLLPGQPLILPATPLIMPPAGAPAGGGRHLVRAVYSQYGLLTEIAAVRVISGRAFSNEIECLL